MPSNCAQCHEVYRADPAMKLQLAQVAIERGREAAAAWVDDRLADVHRLHMPIPAEGWEALPCGCTYSTDEESKTFLFEPCSEDCEMAVYVIEETARQGKPVTVLDAR